MEQSFESEAARLNAVMTTYTPDEDTPSSTSTPRTSTAALAKSIEVTASSRNLHSHSPRPVASDLEARDPVATISPEEYSRLTLADLYALSCAAARERRKRPLPSNTRYFKYECSVCTEQVRLPDFLNDSRNLLPPQCRHHLTLDIKWGSRSDNEPKWPPNLNPEAVCTSCLKRYRIEQFRTCGAENDSCLKAGCLPALAKDSWKYHAQNFLPEDLKEEFNEELARGVYKRDKWTCPADCGCEEGWIATPLNTNGWPYVQCPKCKGGFCARCRASWHAGLSCRDYQRARRWEKDSLSSSPATASPEALSSSASNDNLPVEEKEKYSKENHQSVREMRSRGARLCPRCEAPIFKDGGCRHMECSKCHLHFKWDDAERVQATKEDSAVARKVRAGPFRCIGAWVWRKRKEWGMRREEKKKGSVRCGSVDVDWHSDDLDPYDEVETETEEDEPVPRGVFGRERILEPRVEDVRQPSVWGRREVTVTR